MLRLALATLRSHWVGFVGTLAALALGVAVIATMALVLTAASDGNPHREPVRFAAAPAVIRAKPAIHVTDRFGTPTDVSVAEQPELPASVVTGLAGATPDRTFYAMLPGGPADQAGHGWSSAAFAPYQLVAGHEPRADTEVVVTGGAQPGQTVTVLLRDGPHPFTVAGVVREPASGVVVEHPVFFTDSVAATLSPGVDALVTGDATLLAQARTLPGVQVLTGAQRHEADPGVLQDSADLSNLVSFLGIAALLSSCVSLYVTASTFGLSVAARRRDLALLRAAGATPAQVIRMVCGEAALVGVVGSAGGCALGLVGGPLLAGWMTRNGMAPAWFGVRLTAGSIGALVTAFVAGVAVAVVSVRAGRIRPTEALREAALEHRTMGWPRWLAGGAALAGAVLLLLGLVLLFPSGGTDLKTDVTLALLAIGGTALLAPVLLRPLARLATRPLRSRAGGVLVRARVLTGSRRAAAAVAPVLITVGIAATVLGSTDTSDAAKNTELHRQAATADFVVLPAGTGGLLDQTVARLRAVPGVRASAITDTSVLANAPEVTSLHLEPPTPIPFPAIGVDSAGALRFGVTSGSLDAVSDSTVAVDAGWGRRVGDSMKLWLADGTPVNLRVVAVFDSGLGGTSLVLSQRNAGRALPDRMYLRLDPGADRTAVQDALQAAARAGGARVVPSDRWAAAVSDRQAAQTRLGLVVLLGIAIAYSGIGIANTFLMAVSAQRRELALLRLSGASRRQVLSVVLGESTLLACAGIVLAALVSVVVLGGLDTAFARLVGATPVVLPRVLTGAIAGGGIVLALVATAIPALLILRRRPIELVGIRE